MHRFFTFIATILFSMTLASITYAQSTPLYIDQYPKQLKPEEDVFFTLKSTEDFNLAETNIVWKVDNVTYDQGIGRTTFKTKTPKQNTSRTVTAYIQVPGQNPIYISLPLRASPFTLLYEGNNSITPPFYKGRKLPAKEGSARIGVLTVGTGYKTEFIVNSDKAVIAANNLILTNSRITEDTLEVKATINQNANPVAYITKKIPLVDPEVLLFRENKDTGLRLPVLGSEKGKDLYIAVEPYFFSGVNKYDDSVRYIWKLNDEVKTITEPWFVKLTSTNPQTSQAHLEMRQVDKITQHAEKVFTAIFE